MRSARERRAQFLVWFLICCLSCLPFYDYVLASQDSPIEHSKKDCVSQSGPSSSQRQSRNHTARVLEAVLKGTIQTAAALKLLQDVESLQESLASGAAATRWQATAADSSRPGLEQRHTHDSNDAPHTPAAVHQDSWNTPSKGRKGILVVAGGKHQLGNAYILLTLLTHPDVACNLPVELVYYGPEEYDAPGAAAIQQHAEATGVSVKFMDGSTVAPSGSQGLEPHAAPGWLTGFKAKVHALVWVTSFDQVLMLDSDNTPLADPTPLFETALFKQHGSIFWPDFWTNQWMQPALYSLLGLDTPWEADPGFRACEAGQVLLDRVRHHDVLEYLWVLNMHSNSGIPGAAPGAVGQCLWGDKDTYPIAFQLAGKVSDFRTVPHMPLQALSRPGGSGSSVLVHAGMAHRAPWGEGPLLWLHRTASGKFWPHCMARGGSSCRVWALTTPVDQQQLLATVQDPSAMQMTVQQVDLDWHQQHCRQDQADGNADAAAGSGSSSGCEEGADDCVLDAPSGETVGRQECSAAAEADCGMSVTAQQTGSNATALPCDLQLSFGRLPIPVIRTKHLPQQVKRLFKAAQEAFLASQQLLVAA